MQIEEILIVRHNNIGFGIPTPWIGQILRVPEITPLALSPVEVHGMCAVGGNITTVIDTNLLLGMDAVDTASPRSRILTLEGALNTLALVVSEVYESVTVDPSGMEYLSGSDEPIVAIYHYENELIQIIDVERLVRQIRPKSYTVGTVAEKSDASSAASAQNTKEGRYLLFRMGGEVYGLDIDHLREILGTSNPITLLSGSDDEVIGMMSLRDELVLVVDMRRYYGFEPQPSDKNRILIAQSGSKVVGLMIDEIIDIKVFPENRMEPFAESKGKIAKVVYDNDRLVAIIGGETIEEIIRRHDDAIMSSDVLSRQSKEDVAMEAVVFKLGGEEYAFAIDSVAEIIDMTPITPIAEAPEGVEGVVNIRGQIVTIGSLHRRLGIPIDKEAHQKIIICDTPKGRLGFFVDSVSDVARIRTEELRAEQERGGLFSHTLCFDGGKRLVLLFDLDRLFGPKGGA